MQRYSFGPGYRFNNVFDRLLDSQQPSQQMAGFPPYDLVKEGEHEVRLSVQLPGYLADEVEVESHENRLTIRASRKDSEEKNTAEELTYLHRGISRPEVSRSFELADHFEVTGARLEAGILDVYLHRELPEALQPRRIEIQTEMDANAA